MAKTSPFKPFSGEGSGARLGPIFGRFGNPENGSRMSVGALETPTAIIRAYTGRVQMDSGGCNLRPGVGGERFAQHRGTPENLSLGAPHDRLGPVEYSRHDEKVRKLH